MSEGAAVSFSIRFESESLKRALKRVDAVGTKKIISKTLVDAAQMVARNAASKQIRSGGVRSPVHPTRLTSRTGDLRSSIYGGAGVFPGMDPSGLPNFIAIGSNLNYAGKHEYGTGGMKKRPYLSPALDEEAHKFVDRFLYWWGKEVSK